MYYMRVHIKQSKEVIIIKFKVNIIARREIVLLTDTYSDASRCR